jgi:hypothetical protein
MCDTAGLIAGGIVTKGESIICGGLDRIVGEESKWYLRDKFLQLKYANGKSVDEKYLLHIVGLKLPITFSGIDYYDDSKIHLPIKTEKKITNSLHSSSIIVLKERLDDPINKLISRIVKRCSLNNPLLWVLGEIIRFLAVINKRKKTNASKIQISPEMSLMVEALWNGKSHFKYNAVSDKVPQNLLELIKYMLNTIEKNRPPKGKWREPYIDKVIYPVLNLQLKENLKIQIDNEKKDLSTRIKGKSGLNETREYILAIINIEKILSNHVEAIEKYYIGISKNMSKIYDSLKLFFKLSR